VSTQLNDPELLKRDLCFLDIETTGSIFGYHEIIEVAGIRTTPGGEHVLGEWTQILSPRHPKRVTPYAESLTGFQPFACGSVDVESPQVWQSFVAFARGSVPVCHNPSFERAFISLAAQKAGVEDLGLDYHWIGTESLAWPLFRERAIERMSLASLCDFFRIEREPDVHSAVNGARACRRVYLALLDVLTSDLRSGRRLTKSVDTR
jgi:DNA polymerase III alpha subunit (gram-positive type)